MEPLAGAGRRGHRGLSVATEEVGPGAECVLGELARGRPGAGLGHAELVGAARLRVSLEAQRNAGAYEALDGADFASPDDAALDEGVAAGFFARGRLAAPAGADGAGGEAGAAAGTDVAPWEAGGAAVAAGGGAPRLARAGRGRGAAAGAGARSALERSAVRLSS